MTLTQVRAVSPLAGLRRRSVGEVEVLAQSVAVTAPSAAVATTPALVAATAGLGTVYSYVIAIAVIALVTVCVRQFSSRLAAPGSLYTFVAKGLGPRPALVAGAGLAIGYAVLSMATTVLAAWYGLGLLDRLGVPGTGSRTALVAAIALLGLLVTGCLVRGIGSSSRVALAVESLAVVLIAGILLAVLTHLVGTGRPSQGLTAILGARGADTGGILHGAGLAVASFVGFESAVALGGEARRPLRSIPRAITRTVVAVSVIYLAAAVVQLTSLGSALGDRAAPLEQLLIDGRSSWLAAVLDLAVACSGFACATGAATALARLLFSMAREHGDDHFLGRTDRSSHAPDTAILATMTVVVAVPLALVVLGFGRAHLFSVLLTIATAGYLISYLLVCAALPGFLARIGELTWPTGLVGIAGAILLAFILADLLMPGEPAWLASLVVNLAAAAIALILHARAVAKDHLLELRIGLYDEPVLADLHPSHR